MPIYRVSLREITDLIDPLGGEMWKCERITEEEIRAAHSSGAKEDRSWEGDQVVSEKLSPEEAREFHINRIATLMRDGNEFERIVMILENHKLPIRAYLNDGNHRLAAAYVRGDETISSIIAASHPEGIEDLLPSATILED